MTDTTRLLDGRVDPYMRDILRAAALDEPDEAALERAFTGFAAGAAATAVLAAAKSSGAAAGSVLSVGKVATGNYVAGKVSAALLLKWLGLGALASVMAAGGVIYVSRSQVESPAHERSAAVSVRPTQDRPRSQSVPEEAKIWQFEELRQLSPTLSSAATGSLVPLASPSVRSPVAPSATAASTQTPESGPTSLLAEVAELDRARKALARGNNAGALRVLDQYAASARTHVLDREATIVRIDALVASGQRARAAELARVYVADYPTDSHSRRLRELVDDR